MIIPGYKIKKTARFIRAGIIPYIINRKDKNIHILLAKDRKTMEICDFGGGIKKHESCFEGALREFNEETCGIFNDEITIENLFNSIAICNRKSTHVLFFVSVNPDWYYFAKNKFHKSIRCQTNKECIENSSIFWMEYRDFLQKLQDNEVVIWNRFKKFMLSHGDGISHFFHKKIYNV